MQWILGAFLTEGPRRSRPRYSLLPDEPGRADVDRERGTAPGGRSCENVVVSTFTGRSPVC